MNQHQNGKNRRNFTKRVGKQAVSICLAFTLILGIFPNNAKAAVTPAKSTNIHKESYIFYGAVDDNWSSTVTSYLLADKNGGIIRVEAIGNSVVVEMYSGDEFTLESSLTLTMELPIFGGFYAGSQYNYLVFGQRNTEEEDSCEVLRIVKYTKDWQRVEAAGVYGANTTVPFDAGSLRMCEYGDMLYIRTCHEMYTSDDGYNHQANMTICYNQAANEITAANTGVSNTSTGYVSHSFNQFISQDGEDLYTVDHGDAYPRSIILMKYSGKAGSASLGRVDAALNMISFPGEIGLNYTGASVGALETSSSDCLVAYNSVDQEYFYGFVRNVYVASVDKNNFSSSAVRTKQFTNFSPTGEDSASNPVLVKIPDDRFLLMWEVYDSNQVRTIQGKPGTNTIQYVMLDNEGNAIGDVHTEKADLSDCKPLVTENQVTWYVTDNSAPTFYRLDVTTGKLTAIRTEKEQEDKKNKEENNPNNPTSSSTSKTKSDGTIKPSDTSTAVVTAPAKVKKITAKNKQKKSAILTWEKVSGVKGYQIQYALNKKFTKKKKSKLITKNTGKITIKKLKKKKTYYFRIRAYKLNGTKKVYGSWSKAKKIKIKK
ncbi:MAG: fibronectin type III domain-containing protein [Lachnospiraceae bacterium]|nr:fibronectin type III domain-containing protein [Lachnospiraceae bacterium]